MILDGRAVRLARETREDASVMTKPPDVILKAEDQELVSSGTHVEKSLATVSGHPDQVTER